MKKKIFIRLLTVTLLLSLLTVPLSGCEMKQDENEEEQYREYQEIINVCGIELIGSDIQTAANGTKSVRVYLDSNGYGEYQLDWRVTPTNATNTKVIFNYDESKTYVSVDENGLVKFTRPGVITVILTPADGTVLEKPVEIQVIGLKQ